MWDLTVASAHNFYASAKYANVLVHSCGENINPDDERMEHIVREHGPGTEGNGKGRFNPGTSESDM